MLNFISQGGNIVYILIVLNILGMALIITKLFVLWSFKSNLKLHTNDVVAKFKKWPDSSLSLDILKDEIGRKIFTLERGLSFIKMIASIAPLLGLLGTVWGIFSTFQVISSHGLENPTMFAEGISTALVTTVAGLIVAIPHIMGFHFITGRLDFLENALTDEVMGRAFRNEK